MVLARSAHRTRLSGRSGWLVPTALALAGVTAVTAIAWVAAGGGRRDAARLDAWALWLEWEPSCAELLDRDRAAAISVRWRLALDALAAEVLAAMEERLTAAGGAGGDSDRLLADLLAGSRRLCELARGEPAAAFAPTVARARAELAGTRARLVAALPMEPGERRRRAAPFDRRLSEAVSRALEGAGRGAGGAWPAAAAKSGGAGNPARPSRLEGPAKPPIADPGRRERDRGSPSRVREHPGPEEATGELSIRPSSGETWAEVRQRREERAARRFASWHPLYLGELRRVAELRGKLARELERESLEGLGPLCEQLGRAAERVAGEVVTAAPTAELGDVLAALLGAYAAAGEACAGGHAMRAWDRLSAGDRHWAAAIRAVDEVAAGPPIPRSLRRGSRGGTLVGGSQVE